MTRRHVVHIHVYTARWQPATRYVVSLLGPDSDFVVDTNPRALLYAHCCKARRQARNLEVQVYYDLTRVRCVVGKGCKQ